MEDQSADPGVLTPDTEAVDAPTDKPQSPTSGTPRRWWPARRRASAAEPGSLAAPESVPGSDDEVDGTADVPAAPRVPVGKRKRAATLQPTVGPVGAAGSEVDDEPVGGSALDDPEVSVQTESDVTEPAEGAAEPDTAAAPVDTDIVEEPVLVPHRPAGRRWIFAAAAASGVFVAAGAFAGAMAQPYLADRALVDTKLEVARTASEAITTLWTYTPEDMESLPDRAGKYLAGDFSEQYRRFIDAIVVTNKQSQVTNSTEVVGAAVETITPTEASAIIYTNSVSTSPVSKNIPSLRYLSYRLSMERKDSEWLINRMTAITQLDLTPQL